MRSSEAHTRCEALRLPPQRSDATRPAQQNVCAALTGLVGGVAGAAEAAAAEGVTERLVELLRDDGSRATAGPNVLETLSALASAGGLGTDAALVAGAPAAVVGASPPL